MKREFITGRLETPGLQGKVTRRVIASSLVGNGKLLGPLHALVLPESGPLNTRHSQSGSTCGAVWLPARGPRSSGAAVQKSTIRPRMGRNPEDQKTVQGELLAARTAAQEMKTVNSPTTQNRRRGGF